MTDLKKVIDKELESMTFNELRNRRSIKMKKNFRIKKITAVCAAAIAAAMVLAVSTSAMGLWSMSDFINRVFPDRNGEIEPYAFSSGVSEGSTNLFNFSVSNFLCDGNTLIAEFFVTKADGSEFTQEDLIVSPLNDKLIFPDIDSYGGSGYENYDISDDKLSCIVTRTYTDLPRKIKSGDALQIRIVGAKTSVSSYYENGDRKNYEICDDGTVIFNFTVPEIPDPIPLVFKNENGEKAFEAELTHLSMTAYADEPIFDKYNTSDYIRYALYRDYISDPDEQAEWDERFISDPTTPNFYDENMQLTDNIYNGTKSHAVDSSGIEQRWYPDCIKYFFGQHASITFTDDPEFENAKYIEWLGCIAEIPDMSE